MNDEFTPWFPGELKPARVGVYQRILDDNTVIFYSLWDGYRWRWSELTVAAAARQTGESVWLWCTWRGLAKEPK